MSLLSLIPSIIGVASDIFGGNEDKRATDKALSAQTLGNDRALAEQAEARNQIIGLNQPYVNTGYAALDNLSAQFLGGAQPQYAPQAPSRPGGAGQSYQTTGFGGVQAPPGYYFGPSDELLPIPGGQPGAQPQSQPQAPAGPDFGGYLTANPDVMAEYQRVAATADRNSPQFAQLGLDRGPEGFAQWHYQNYGQGEGRQLPQTAPKASPQAQQQAAAPAAAPAPAAQVGPTAPNLMNAPRPEAAPAPTFDRPSDLGVPTFQRQEAGPGPSFTFDPSQLANDKGYQFQLRETLDAANSGFAARGMLKSGAAAKGVMDRANGLAATSINDIFNRQLGAYGAQRSAFENDRGRADNIFSQDRSYGTNLWQVQQGRQDQQFADDRAFGTDNYRYDTNRTDQNFNTDRNYQANRYDTQTNNIFRLAGMGLQAAGATGAAAGNYANNAGNIFGNQATAVGNAANAQGQANAGIAGSIAGAASNIFNNYGGSTTPFSAQTTESISRANPFQLPAGTSRIPNVVF